MSERHDFLKTLPADARAIVDRDAEEVTLAAGKTLFRTGDTPDALYLVLSGSLGVYVPGIAGATRLVGIIRHGETVGEMGVLSNKPRSASVVAIRDCDLLKLTKVKFDRLMRRQPALMAGLNRLLVHRLRRALAGSHRSLEPKTVALLPCTPAFDLNPVAARLVTCLRNQGLKTLEINEKQAGKSSRWFTRQEDNHDHVVMTAEGHDRNWLQVCARQADRILVFADANQPPGTNLPAGLLKQRAAHQLLDLVIVHNPPRAQPESTSDWLDKLPVNRHFHLRFDVDGDWDRLARIIGGRAIGLVLGGGGARAYAHMGVLQAFRDAGVPVDFFGGSSMGAIVAAGVAIGWSLEELDERLRETFVKSNPLSDYALPIISLVRGRKVERLLYENFGNTDIADTWQPFFCVSSNLTTAKVMAHKRGSLVEALRASIALPGILPPVVTDDGVLADGAVINNLPVDVMRGLHRGPIAVVDVARDLALDPDWMRSEMNAGSLSRMLRPPIISVLIRAGTVTGEEQSRQQAHEADLVIEPPLGQIEIRDWKAYDRAVAAGYDYTIDLLERQRAKLLRRRRTTVL